MKSTPPKKPKAAVRRPGNSLALTGTPAAKQSAAVLLEVLSGHIGPSEASELLKVALSRYYVLEVRALQGLVSALEPRPKGPQKTAADERDALANENKRLQRELGRTQALLRAAQRGLGLGSRVRGRGKSKLGDTTTSKTGRRRRRVNRASKAIARLRKDAEPSPPKEESPCPPDVPLTA